MAALSKPGGREKWARIMEYKTLCGLIKTKGNITSAAPAKPATIQVISFLRSFSNREKTKKYSDFSSAEQKKILKKSVREANQDQLSVIKSFDSRPCSR